MLYFPLSPIIIMFAFSLLHRSTKPDFTSLFFIDLMTYYDIFSAHFLDQKCTWRACLLHVACLSFIWKYLCSGIIYANALQTFLKMDRGSNWHMSQQLQNRKWLTEVGHVEETLPPKMVFSHPLLIPKNIQWMQIVSTKSNNQLEITFCWIFLV